MLVAQFPISWASNMCVRLTTPAASLMGLSQPAQIQSTPAELKSQNAQPNNGCESGIKASSRKEGHNNTWPYNFIDKTRDFLIFFSSFMHVNITFVDSLIDTCIFQFIFVYILMILIRLIQNYVW